MFSKLTVPVNECKLKTSVSFNEAIKTQTQDCCVSTLCFHTFVQFSLTSLTVSFGRAGVECYCQHESGAAVIQLQFLINEVCCLNLLLVWFSPPALP